MPSRRTRRARRGSFQGQKPNFGSPMVNKPEGGPTSFTVYSLDGDPRIPGTKSYEELMARCRRLRKWCKNSCIIFKAYDVHSALGIEEEEPQCNYRTGSTVEESLCNCETSDKLEVPNIGTSPPQDVLDAIHRLNNAVSANRAAGLLVRKRTEYKCGDRAPF